MHTPSVHLSGRLLDFPSVEARRLSLPNANLGDFSQKLGSPGVASLLRVQRVGLEHAHEHVVDLVRLGQLDDGVAQRVHAVGGAGHQDLELLADGEPRRLRRSLRVCVDWNRRHRRSLAAVGLDRRRATLVILALRLALPGDRDPLLESLQLDEGFLPRRTLRGEFFLILADVLDESLRHERAAADGLVVHGLHRGGEEVFDEGVEVLGHRTVGGVAAYARDDGLLALDRGVHRLVRVRALLRLERLHALGEDVVVEVVPVSRAELVLGARAGRGASARSASGDPGRREARATRDARARRERRG
mmetsp:Transcript_8187/g.33581  ORF Transcript_8187/g.33581 Transcript_8187/m.33581 type:complete len:304 (+) Transcript_8187:195-1106(+)